MESAASRSLPFQLLQRLASSSEMRAMDTYAIESINLPGRILMEDAAGQVAAITCDALAEHESAHPVTVCCGMGNNGGDGYAAARLLQNRGVETIVIELGEARTDDAAKNREAWAHFGASIDFVSQPDQALKALNRASAVVDAIYGTGLARPVTGEAEALITAMNASPAAVKVAVDIPSGIHADTGSVMGSAVRCTHTVTFQVGKIGLYQHPGAEYAGKVNVVPISIPPRWPDDAPSTSLLTGPFVAELLPRRQPAGHKGSFGHLLAMCGSAGMAGAAGLAGMGALRIGTGLVTLGVPRQLLDNFVGIVPELMTLAADRGADNCFDGSHVDTFVAAVEGRSAVMMGCGLGRNDGTGVFARELVSRVDKPMLIDADGLYFLDGDKLRARPAPTVITPHPGELSRLAGLSVETLNEDRVGHARRLAGEWGVVLVFKGAGTVVAEPGGAVFINPTGDSGLASGGTGDVLSGMIAGLMAQRVDPLAAALAGVYLHGLARDLSRGSRTGASFTASDLVEGIDNALRMVSGD